MLATCKLSELLVQTSFFQEPPTLLELYKTFDLKKIPNIPDICYIVYTHNKKSVGHTIKRGTY